MRPRRVPTISLGTCSLVLLALAGCGGGSARVQEGGESYATSSGYEMSIASTGSDESDAAPAPDSAGSSYQPERGGSAASFEGDVVEGELVRPSPPMLAQAQPPPSEPDETVHRAHVTATDAVDTSGPLLIYVATFHLAVYEVAESQSRIIGVARELGGFVFAQSDDRVVVRVPALRFDAMLGAVEQAGDVEHRDVQAQDVSEEFHDVEIRIRNLEAMRARVEALLAQARNVEEALQVEQQLARITQELERMRGRQRFLADRIAFSTITVMFRPRPRESIGQPDVVPLPFGWLDSLGLSTLLELR